MPDHTTKAAPSNPSRFPPLVTVVVAATDPANLALIASLGACVSIVAAETNDRFAVLLTAAALMLLVTRMRHAVTLATVMLCAFAAAVLMHVPRIETHPPVPRAVVHAPAGQTPMTNPARAGRSARVR